MADATDAQRQALDGALEECKNRLQEMMSRIDGLSVDADRAGNHHLADKYNEMYSDLALELRLLLRDEIEQIDSSEAMQRVIDGLTAATAEMNDKMDSMRDLASALNLVAGVTGAINKVSSGLT